jgi:hypothetical protein
MKVDGACHCGAITYEAVIDPETVAIYRGADRQHVGHQAHAETPKLV